jgi:hypothetical protein
VQESLGHKSSKSAGVYRGLDTSEPVDTSNTSSKQSRIRCYNRDGAAKKRRAPDAIRSQITASL